MGYLSQVAICLNKTSKDLLNEMLDKANEETQKNVQEFLAQADRHLADAASSSEAWFWNWIKWYPDYPEISFMENMFNLMDMDNFLFIRAGEYSDDSEIQGAYRDNPFGMHLSRSIEFC